MSEDKQQSNKSLLQQIREEAEKANRAKVKDKLKVLYSDYAKAKEVLDGIVDQIATTAKEAGDSEEEIRKLLSVF